LEFKNIKIFIPLSEMFGYETTLWYLKKYEAVPNSIKEAIIKERSGKFKSLDDE